MVGSRFPHSGVYPFADQTLTAAEVVKIMGELLTQERRERIEKTILQRTCNVVPVLENIYDRGNISAVLRTAEALGYQCAHVIELGEKFKSSNRVTQGADKWLDVRRWKSTVECVSHLKSQGFQVLATHLDDRARPLSEIDCSRPTALVLGNEKDGISQEMIELADQTVIIPMSGFVQSFNISVAGAIALYHIYLDRVRSGIAHGDLSDDERAILRAEFYMRSSKNPKRWIEQILARQPQ